MSRDVILLFEMNPGVESLLARGSCFQDPSVDCQQPQQASQSWKASHGVKVSERRLRSFESDSVIG